MCECPMCEAGYPLYREYTVRQDDGTYLCIKVRVKEENEDD